MKSKFFKVVGILLSTAVIFTACTAGPKKESEKSKSQGESSKQAADGMLGNMYLKGLPIVKEKESFTMLLSYGGTKDPNEMKMHKILEESTNVKVIYDAVPSTAKNERKSTVFASGQYPDTMGASLLTDSDVISYGMTGVFIPLEGLIKDYAPNLQKILNENEYIHKMLTAPDGHIYSLPMINNRSVWPSADKYVADQLVINKNWLDKLGLKAPKNINEFYNVLKEFKTKDPNGNNKNDEIPFTFVHKGWSEGLKSMFGVFGIIDIPEHIMVENNQVKSTAIQPNYKEAILYFKKLYSEGLIDPEAFTHDKKAFTAKCSQNPAIVGSLVSWAGYNEFGLERAKTEYMGLEPLEGPTGKKLWSREMSGAWRNRLAITSSAKNPEVIMRWADNLFDPEISVQITYGPYGTNLNKRNDGKIDILPPPEGMTMDQFLLTETTRGLPYAVMGDMVDRIIIDPSMTFKNEMSKLMAPYGVKEIYPSVYFTNEEQETLNSVEKPIIQYIDQKQAQWITGQADINAEWDKYVSQLEKMGLSQVIKIRQKALERFNK